MNRRGFLRLLGLAAVAPVAAKLVPDALIADTTTTITFPPVGSYPLEITIGEYADYCNFTDLALASTLDPALTGFAKELSYRMAFMVDTMNRV